MSEKTHKRYTFTLYTTSTANSPTLPPTPSKLTASSGQPASITSIQKFPGTRQEERIRKANTPMMAANMGRDRKQRLRKNWESIKIDVMRKALFAKFTQHEELRELLLSTGSADLIEHTENDAFWGDGGDGKGRNWLGRLLVELRTRLQQDE